MTSHTPGKETLDYPQWVCARCGHRHGRRSPDVASWHTGECGVCGDYAPVTEPRDFGHIQWPLTREEMKGLMK